LSRGKIWLDGHALDLPAGDVPSGEARLYFRPHDVVVSDELAGAIAGEILAFRRHGGTRRVDLEVSGRDRIEIELPADFSHGLSDGSGYARVATDYSRPAKRLRVNGHTHPSLALTECF
jgi:ABC-type sulfate/molybdate transport systems ATPase subunit